VYIIAERLRAIGEFEEHHEGRFKKILEQIEASTVWKKNKEVEWICRCMWLCSCKFEPLEKCPSCDHPTKYFQILCILRHRRIKM